MKQTAVMACVIGCWLAAGTAARAEGTFSSEEASVRETPEGIEAAVSIGGKRETFRARNWDEFKRKYPKIYERHFRGSGPGGGRAEARSEAGGHFKRFTDEVAGCPKCQEFGMCGHHGEILQEIRDHMQDAPPELRARAREWLIHHEGKVKERMTARFDADKNGTLDEAERRSAREAIETRHPGLLDKCRDRREDFHDRREDFRDRREDVYDRAEDVRDARRDGPAPDLFRSIYDEREDKRDLKEDRRDRAEDRLDRREDIWDDAHDGGRKDRIEDRFDKAEDRRDKREDVRDRIEDRRDRKK